MAKPDASRSRTADPQNPNAERSDPDAANRARFNADVAARYRELQEASLAGRIVACADCSRLISRRAFLCPGCGAPNSVKLIRMLIWLTVLVALTAWLRDGLGV